MTVKTFPLPPSYGYGQPAPSSGTSNMFTGLLPALAGGIFSAFTASKRNKEQARQAQKQMDFQERMSSTAYQRATKDLEAAGLNRILALGSPSSSPGGSQATVADVGPSAINSALAVKRQQAEIKNIEANTLNLGADTRLKGGTEFNIDTDTQNKILQQAGIQTENKKKLLERDILELRIPELKSIASLWKYLDTISADETVKLMGMSGATLAALLKTILASRK